MLEVLLDTSILVGEWRRVPTIVEFVRQIRRRAICHVSVLTRMELLRGAQPRYVEDTRAFLDRYQTIEVSAGIADLAGRLGWTFRKTHGSKTGDLVIAATAISHRLSLATLNGRDFPMPQLRLYPVPNV